MFERERLAGKMRVVEATNRVHKHKSERLVVYKHICHFMHDLRVSAYIALYGIYPIDVLACTQNRCRER